MRAAFTAFGTLSVLYLVTIGGTAPARAAVAPVAADAAAGKADLAAAASAPKRARQSPALAIPVCVPIGLAVDSKNELFVANHYGSGTSCGSPGQITVYDSSGKQLPKRTITDSVQNPAGLAFDSSGHLYVADASQDKVFVYSASGKLIPSKTLTTDANYNPSGVQIAPNGEVWVANRTGNNIGIGEIQIFKGLKVKYTTTTGLVYPLGIAFQPGGKIAWVGNAESPNDAMTTYKLNGQFYLQYTTPGFTPGYLAFQNASSLVVSDPLSNVVAFYNTSGTQTGSFSDGVAYPYGIAIDSTGAIYVANVGYGGNYNGSSITKYTSAGVLVCTITSSGCY
jgi:hypothetical protein